MSDNYAAATTPLFRRLEREAFSFIIVFYNHLSLATRVEADLRRQYPARAANSFNCRTTTYADFIDAYIAQENGFFFLHHFEDVLHLETNSEGKETPEMALGNVRRKEITIGLNRRRDRLAKQKIALIVFVQGSGPSQAVPLMEKMPDLWSVRSLILDLKQDIVVERGLETMFRSIGDGPEISSLGGETEAEKRETIAALQDRLHHLPAGEQALRKALDEQLKQLLFEIGESDSSELQSKVQKRTAISKFLGNQPNFLNDFLGREIQISRFKNLLSSTSDLPILLVNGEAGIGKTSFVAEYYRRNTEYYKHLVWLYADTGIAQALLRIAPALGIQFDERADTTERFRILLDEFRNIAAPSLLVLDNANDPQDLKAYALALRGLPNFHIIITSRVTDCDGLDSFSLPPLAHDPAVELFERHFPEHNRAENALLDQFLKAVGYNTLVIELLAKNLHQFARGPRKNYGLAQMLDDLGHEGLFGIHGKKVSTVYQATGFALRNETPEAILDAMYKLGDLSDAEQALMSVLAVLPAESIAFTWLEQLILRDDLEETLTSLAEKGWVEYQPKGASYKVSPVVQFVTRRQNAERLWGDCAGVVGVLSEKLDYQPSTGHFENASYEDAAFYARFGEAILQVSWVPQPRLRILSERLGSFHSTLGDLRKSLYYFEIYQRIAEALVSQNPNDPNINKGLAISFEKLGNTHSALGDLQRALGYYAQCNELRRELILADPSNVSFKNGLAISFSKLGDTYAALGELQQALGYYEQELRLSEELYTADPNNVSFNSSLSVSYSNLGDTHIALGDLQKALGYYADLTKLSEELHAAHPSNVSFKSGLAVSFSKLGDTNIALGDLQQAFGYYEQSLQLNEELHTAHPSNVSFKNGLAVSYWKLGNLARKTKELDRAREHFQKCEQLLSELVKAAPAFVEYQKNLEVVQGDLEGLGK